MFASWLHKVKSGDNIFVTDIEGICCMLHLNHYYVQIILRNVIVKVITTLIIFQVTPKLEMSIRISFQAKSIIVVVYIFEVHTAKSAPIFPDWHGYWESIIRRESLVRISIKTLLFENNLRCMILLLTTVISGKKLQKKGGLVTSLLNARILKKNYVYWIIL